MAIKISGSTIIDDSRNIVNAGIITATSFSGDGSGLTGVTAVGSGVGVQDDGSVVGSATTINFGTNLSVSLSNGIATIDAASVGAAGTWAVTSVGIHTTKNVGIGTTNPTSRLTVIGDTLIVGVITSSSFSGNASSATYAESAGIATSVIGGNASVTQLNVSGVSTFSGITTVSGTTLFVNQISSSGVVTATRFESSSAGTPTIDSPNNLNINAVNVAISTDVTIGRDAYVGVNTSAGLVLTDALGVQWRLGVTTTGSLFTTLV